MDDEFIIILDYGTPSARVVNEILVGRDAVVAYHFDHFLETRSFRVFKLINSGCVLRSEDGPDALAAFRAKVTA